MEDQRFAKRIAAGIWVDRGGGLHISIPELLEHFQCPDTPANRRYMETTVKDYLAKELPRAKVTHQGACPYCGSEGLEHQAGCLIDKL
jgi:hypothetical protein